MEKVALGIIDAQRGFMPASEAGVVSMGGFGQLPVPNGEQIVEPVNRLLRAAALHDLAMFTTQDWHPNKTAHFAEQPNFVTNWPRHCVGGTLGASLHPWIAVPAPAVRFIKGFEPLERGEDDTSYSGYYAVDPTTKTTLPEWLGNRGVTKIVLGGLALDYCVGKTALDLRTKLGLEVVVAIDATRAITDQSGQAMLDEFKAHGIQTATTAEAIGEMR